VHTPLQAKKEKIDKYKALVNSDKLQSNPVYAAMVEHMDDALGTVITHRAGFSPLKGAAFFTRIPDPGDRFLGTHPPNAARIQTVRDTVKTLN
jgi:predicted Zn-dependent protease